MAYDIDELDKAIIKELAQTGNLGPSGIVDRIEIDTTRQTVHTRLNNMKIAGYIERVDHGIYSLVDDPRD